jgi:acyl-coenzyme A thioesterase PaaI-like protein
MPESLQERYAAHSICYGCGPANPRGLRIRSFVSDAGDGEDVVADWTPEPHHEAFPGILNGGIIGTLLDCHCNWAAAHHLMQRDGLDRPPCTVTAEYTIRMQKPTPSAQPVRLRARILESAGSRVTVEGELEAAGRVTATCRGLFVAVEPGHPAYHRW